MMKVRRVEKRKKDKEGERRKKGKSAEKKIKIVDDFSRVSST